MKKITVSLFILVFTLGLCAQQTDSILLERVDKLKKEVSLLKNKNRSLQSQVYSLKKAHAEDAGKVEEKFTATDEALQKGDARDDDLEKSIQASEDKSLESITMLGDWTKKVVVILAVVLVVLFLVLLILAITGRSRTGKEMKKLEAKVDKAKESIDLEVKEAIKKLEDQISALKEEIEKGKK
jgi:hypothetical protein